MSRIMSAHDLRLWQHAHDYATAEQRQAERRTRWVVGLTFLTMLVELAAGWFTGSMALLADAWHMASHVGALGLAAFAYDFARRHAGDTRYTFGTGKVSALAGYSSALLLGGVAAWMVWESLQRLLAPLPIRYGEAMAVAVLGLAVNLASAWLLDHDHHPGHDHHDEDHHAHDHDHHDHEHHPGHHHDHVDHNLRAAYLHVLADALTSVLAILALAGGMVWGWSFLDPMMGFVGAALVGRWAWGLAGESARVLLDAEDHGATAAEIRRRIAALPDHEVADLHLWRVGPASRACILSLLTHEPRPLEEYRALLAPVPGLDHLTVEVNQCRDARCLAPARP
ncbi:MAG: CDF family Co(II)/Ni(II) efflux transporter DmeF [Pseudomonadota bacterium]